jgi:hypothetical protein
MERYDLSGWRLGRRQLLATAGRLGLGAAALAGLGPGAGLLAGCGGGSDSTDTGTAVGVNRTGRFYTKRILQPVEDIAVDIGRTYVELNNGVPVEIGWEATLDILSGLPRTAFDDPGIYFMALPPEADATPFKFMAFSDWGRGHKPVGIGDAPHVHPVVCIAPPGAPTDDNRDERVPVADPDEIPEGYVLGDTIPGAGDTIAPGIGEAYEYPEAPQLQPGWNTTAQNYFFYRGHLNGIGMGASYEFLRAKRTATLPCTQPRLYPKAGYYPTKNVTTYDNERGVFVFKLTDFVRAARWIGQSA